MRKKVNNEKYNDPENRGVRNIIKYDRSINIIKRKIEEYDAQ
jgi:hypothetical protein